MRKLFEIITAFFQKHFGKAKSEVKKPKIIYEAYPITDFDFEIMKHINDFRTLMNKPKLAINATLCAIAYSHCKYMAAKRTASHDFFMQRASEFPENYYCENVAYNYKTPEAFVRAWIQSIQHRENMLDNLTHIGIAWAADVNGKKYVTTQFINAGGGRYATREERRKAERITKRVGGPIKL